MNTSQLEQALSLHQSGDLEAAEKAYLDIVMDDPGNAEALKFLGLLACQQNNFEEGIAYIEAAIENDSTQAEYHLVLGRALLASGKVEEGITSVIKAGEIDPSRAEIFATLRDTYQHVQNFPEALRSYQRAMAIEPENTKVRIGAGLSAIFAGQNDAAREYLEKANEEDQSFPQVYYGLALIDLEEGNKDEAAKNIEAALALDPDNPEYQRVQKTVASP